MANLAFSFLSFYYVLQNQGVFCHYPIHTIEKDYFALMGKVLPYVYPVPNLEDGLFIGERSKFRRALDGPPVVENNLADFMVEVCSGILLFRRLLWSGRARGNFWVAGLITDISNRWSSFLFEGLVTGQKSGVTGAIADEAPELYQLIWNLSSLDHIHHIRTSTRFVPTKSNWVVSYQLPNKLQQARF